MKKIELQNYEKVKRLNMLFRIVLVLLIIAVIGSIVYKILSFEEKPKIFCGDFRCSPGEEETCCIDCGCPKNIVCKNNVCVSKVEEVIEFICGNNVCEKDEGCFSCGFDCKCSENEYCNPKSDTCKPIICGNNRCERNETQENCCVDCGCDGDYTCNIITRKCQREALITQEEAEEVVQEYLIEQKISEKCSIAGSIHDILKNESVISVAYNCSDELPWQIHFIFVDSQGKIVGNATTV